MCNRCLWPSLIFLVGAILILSLSFSAWKYHDHYGHIKFGAVYSTIGTTNNTIWAMLNQTGLADAADLDETTVMNRSPASLITAVVLTSLGIVLMTFLSYGVFYAATVPRAQARRHPPPFDLNDPMPMDELFI